MMSDDVQKRRKKVMICKGKSKSLWQDDGGAQRNIIVNYTSKYNSIFLNFDGELTP